MNFKQLQITLAVGATLAVLSAPVSAYGPRDSMAYPHPAQMPMSEICDGSLQQIQSHNPRRADLYQVCQPRMMRNSRIRLDSSGPRPRAVVEKRARAAGVTARR